MSVVSELSFPWGRLKNLVVLSDRSLRVDSTDKEEIKVQTQSLEFLIIEVSLEEAQRRRKPFLLWWLVPMGWYQLPYEHDWIGTHSCASSADEHLFWNGKFQSWLFWVERKRSVSLNHSLHSSEEMYMWWGFDWLELLCSVSESIVAFLSKDEINKESRKTKRNSYKRISEVIGKSFLLGTAYKIHLYWASGK